MKKKAKRVLLDTIGWIFVAVGIAGFFLPFLQGILFLFLGIYFLSLHSPWFHFHLEKIKQRYPKLITRFDRFDEKVRALFGIEKINL